MEEQSKFVFLGANEERFDLERPHYLRAGVGGHANNISTQTEK
jgi:hypothetical protein